MRRGERRKGWRKFWKNDDKKTDEMDRKECRKMMKTNKGRRWKMKKNVGWGVCMKQFICGARPSTTLACSNHVIFKKPGLPGLKTMSGWRQSGRQIGDQRNLPEAPSCAPVEGFLEPAICSSPSSARPDIKHGGKHRSRPGLGEKNCLRQHGQPSPTAQM